jgi:peptide/nickel transport system substrate-binding protein
LKRRRLTGLVVGLLSLSAACIGGGNEPRRGGSIVIGAEQWPDCVNPVNFCSQANWGFYAVFQHVMPRAMNLDEKGNFRASPLLLEAPSLRNGLLTKDPFTVTYKIRPAAVWDDGSPITSVDFDFTWRAIINTPGGFTAGYDQIESIDTSQPKDAVLHFKDTFVEWPNLFGGAYGGLLKKSAFPTADAEKPNLENEMLDRIPFSGGPWRLQSWSRYEAVLVPNNRYWGPKPHADRVRIIPIVDQAAELEAFRRGQIAAIYPQPGDADLVGQLRVRNAKVQATPGVYFEALWFNVTVRPLDNVLVREAVMYAVNRARIVEEIARVRGDPGARVLNCGFVSYTNQGPWCHNEPFREFSYSPKKAISALERAGYDCSNVPQQPCSKNGKPLILGLAHPIRAHNAPWYAEDEIVREDARAAGIKIEFKDYDAQTLFGQVGPQGKFQIGHWATGGSIDPSVTHSLGCDWIPTTQQQYADLAYGNWNRWCDRRADDLMKRSDVELDPAARLRLFDQIYELQRSARISLPLLVTSNIGAWRTDQVTGPVSAYVPSIAGMLYNLSEWSVAEP